MSAQEDITDTLDWMIADMNFRRDQTANGLDPERKSPQMIKAEWLLAELQAGTIVCRRKGE